MSTDTVSRCEAFAEAVETLITELLSAHGAQCQFVGKRIGMPTALIPDFSSECILSTFLIPFELSMPELGESVHFIEFRLPYSAVHWPNDALYSRLRKQADEMCAAMRKAAKKGNPNE